MPNESVKERHVHAYLKPCNIIFFTKYVDYHKGDKTKSVAVNDAIEALKKSLPPTELKIIMAKNSY